MLLPIQIHWSVEYSVVLVELQILVDICVDLELVSIKCGLRTTDCGLRTGYKIRTRYKMQTGKYGLGIKCGLQTADWV